jgi:hypothetical protein
LKGHTVIKKVIPLLLVVLIGFECSSLQSPQVRATPYNIILIGWDGAQRNHVNECLARGELPNLKRLIDKGTFVEIDIEGSTDTRAGWTQILTGYYPTITDVYSNDRYQPIPKGLTVFERLEKHFGDDNIVTMAVVGKLTDVDCDPPEKIEFKKGDKKRTDATIIGENGVKYQLVPGKPYYYTKDRMDMFENGLIINTKAANRAMELIERNKNNRFFMFVHFAESDTNGHKMGENSNEYNEALISNDFWTGRIIKKLKKLGLYERTLIYITADHGFDEGKTTHYNAPYVFLATNDKMVCRNGRRQDIAPTILERFGIDPTKLDPPLDGISLTKPDNRPEPKLGPQESTASTTQSTQSDLTQTTAE